MLLTETVYCSQLYSICFSREECVHGKCVANNPENCCICETGWSGEACDRCVPYWDCPELVEEACVNPNECICTTPNLNDPKGLCQHPKINPKINPNLKIKAISPSELFITLKPCDPTKYQCNV